MHPPAQPLPQRPLVDRGQPQRRHKLTAAELGEQARVDLVRLRRQRRHRLHLARVRDLDLPAASGQLVPDPDRAAHHLHAGLHLVTEAKHELGEPVPVSRDAALTGNPAAGSKRAPLRLSISPIDSDILHLGPPSRWDSSPDIVRLGGPSS